MASRSNKAGNAAEIDRLALALAKEPGSKAFIPLAEEYGKAGMWEEAAAVLEDGLKTYPGFIVAMVALGRAYDQMNRPVKAKAVLEEAVKLSPENLRAHRTLAKIYVVEGAKDAALRSCDVILAVNPYDQEALSLRASLGSSVPAASAETPAPPRAHQPGESAAVSSLLPRIIQTGTAKVEPIGNAHGAQAAAIPESNQEGFGLNATSAGSTSNERRKTTVAQLEQWLATIEARRRDRNFPPNQALPLPK